MIVAAGNEDLFETLIAATLARGISLETAALSEDSKGRRPVHIAALHSSTILKAMNRHGLSMDVQSPDGRSVFHYAAQAVLKKGSESLEYLCTMEIPSDILAQDGSTVAHDIFKDPPIEPDLESLMFLAEGVAVLRRTGADMRRCMLDGSNILHAVCKFLSRCYRCARPFLVQECIENILTAGVQPNVKDADDACPLDIILARCHRDDRNPRDHEEAAMIALANAQSRTELLAYQWHGMSLLHYAAGSEMNTLCRILLDRGMDVDDYSSHGYNLTLCDDPQCLSSIQVLAWRACPVAILKSAMEKTKALKSFGRHGYNFLHLVAGTSVAHEERVGSSLRAMLDAGFDPNAPVNGHDGPTALMLAASQNHVSAVRILLEHGADISMVDAKGWTSLDWACLKNSHETVEFLLPYTQSIHPCQSTRYFSDTELLFGPLELAAWDGRERVAGTLLRARLKYSSAPTVSALWAACKAGSLPIACMLIDDGADLEDVWAGNGQLLLHAAAQDGSEDVISMLLSTGNDFRLLDAYGLPPSYYARASEYTTILPRLEEWERSQAETTDVLLAENAKMDKSLAWQEGLASTISCIVRDCDIESLAKVFETVDDATAVDLPLPCGCTTFVLAVSLAKGNPFYDIPPELGFLEVCEFLLSKSPCLTTEGCFFHSEGKTPLEIAAAENELIPLFDTMIRSRNLPQCIIESSTCDQSGSLLHIAVRRGNQSAVSLLIEAGVCIDCADPDLLTPLHSAARRDDARILRLLLEAGANPNSRDRKLRTAAHLAAENGATTTLIELAKDSRTDLGLYDGDLLLPIQEAAYYGHLEAVHTLVLLGQGIDYAADTAGSHSARTLLLSEEGCLSYALHGPSELTDPFVLWGWRARSLSELRYSIRAFSRNTLFEALNTLHLSHVSGYRVRPIYSTASKSELSLMETLVDSGGLINLEGGPEGTALMAACAFGRLDSVKMLIRLGAVELYNKGEIVFNAITKARHHPQVIHWLLVGRYTDQYKLTSSADEPNTNVLYSVSPGQASTPQSKPRVLNLDLVLEEDWDAYLAKLQPRSTRSFVCQMYGRECINYEVATGSNLEERSLSRLLRRQSF